MRRGQRWGGPKSLVQEIVGGTIQDLGISKVQLDAIAGNANSLFPPMQLPHPVKLIDEDAYLIQKHRIVQHQLDQAILSRREEKQLSVDMHVHATTPKDENTGIFLPAELGHDANKQRNLEANFSGATLQPKSLDRRFKQLESREKKLHVKDSVTEENYTALSSEEEPEDDLGDDMNDYTLDYHSSDASIDEDDGEVSYY